MMGDCVEARWACLRKTRLRGKEPIRIRIGVDRSLIIVSHREVGGLQSPFKRFRKSQSIQFLRFHRAWIVATTFRLGPRLRAFLVSVALFSYTGSKCLVLSKRLRLP